MQERRTSDLERDWQHTTRHTRNYRAYFPQTKLSAAWIIVICRSHWWLLFSRERGACDRVGRCLLLVETHWYIRSGAPFGWELVDLGHLHIVWHRPYSCVNTEHNSQVTAWQASLWKVRRETYVLHDYHCTSPWSWYIFFSIAWQIMCSHRPCNCCGRRLHGLNWFNDLHMGGYKLRLCVSWRSHRSITHHNEFSIRQLE